MIVFYHLFPLLNVSNGWYAGYEAKLGVVKHNKLTCREKNYSSRNYLKKDFYLKFWRLLKPTVGKEAVVGLVC